MPTISIQVHGKVQGVYYRASAHEKAVALGLTGWVRNMPDGSVYLEATGPQAQLDQLEAWCGRGPVLARVTSVVKSDLPEKFYPTFEVLR